MAREAAAVRVSFILNAICRSGINAELMSVRLRNGHERYSGGNVTRRCYFVYKQRTRASD